MAGELFQSAPLAEARGDIPGHKARMGMAALFQSAPLAEARGDPPVPQAPYTRAVRFNPLPLPKQGEISRGAIAAVEIVAVSIRSPCRSKGRFLDGRTPQATRQVSIRSPCRSKGRCRTRHRVVRPRIGFNPLPLPKQGEIYEVMAENEDIQKFQSAPLAEARGDSSVSPWTPSSSQFQSAPLAEARGDASCCNQQMLSRLYRQIRDSIK